MVPLLFLLRDHRGLGVHLQLWFRGTLGLQVFLYYNTIWNLNAGPLHTNKSGNIYITFPIHNIFCMDTIVIMFCYWLWCTDTSKWVMHRVVSYPILHFLCVKSIPIMSMACPFRIQTVCGHHRLPIQRQKKQQDYDLLKSFLLSIFCWYCYFTMW